MHRRPKAVAALLNQPPHHWVDVYVLVLLFLTVIDIAVALTGGHSKR